MLRKAGESRERRAQATHAATVKPELAAAGPNQVYSWDITKLHGPAKLPDTSRINPPPDKEADTQ